MSDGIIHAYQWRTSKPLTVWRCDCGTLEVGTPESPYPTRRAAHRPWRLRPHNWAPVSQDEADVFLASLDALPRDGDS